MKYFLLRRVTDAKIIGRKNILGQVELDESNPIIKKLKEFLGVNYWNIGKTVPDFEVENCSASLTKGANLTDFLTFSPYLIACPFMLSERLAAVFNQFNIQKNYQYKCTIYQNGSPISEKYYLFYCPLLDFDVVDFSQSKFYTGRSVFSKEKEYVYFSDSQEFKNNYVVDFRIEKLALNSGFDKTLDFFQGRIGEMYVSEALKDAIELLGFTGVNMFDDLEPQIMIL